MYFVDKYLMIVMIFLIVSIPISFVDINSGEIREEPLILLFYTSIGGIAIIIVYSSYKDRKERRAANAKRRRSKK